MSDNKLIAVVGVTGNQGGSVARTFSSIPGWSVRGITRNPDKPSNQHLRQAGIELVSADLNTRESLVKAFSGANAIFGVTDFWQFASNPEVAAEAKQRGKKVNAVFLKSEGKLERLVLSTLSDTKKWTGGRITENLHFDGKAAGTRYLKEANTPELKALCAKTSYVQIGWCMDNWRQFDGLNAPRLQPDGTFIFATLGIPPYEKEIPFVHPPTDTGPFVKALVLNNPAGTSMLGASQMMRMPRFVEMLARHFGQEIKMRALTRDDMVKVMGEDFGVEVVASGDYATTVGWTGGDPEVKLPWDLGVDMSTVTTPEMYIAQTDWSRCLKSK